jgi:hypothetical protein
VGEYRCTVIASNAAGSASQTSALAAIFKVGKARLNRRRGIARLPVRLPGRGILKVSGKGYKAVTKSVSAAKTVKLTIRARGKFRRKLNRSGKVKLRLTFNLLTEPPAAFAAVQTKSVVLRKR